MKNLISNTQFGIYLDTQEMSLSCYKQTRQKYDYFLSSKIEIWMFVPCDEDGNVLEEPKEYKEYVNSRLLDAFNNIKELGKCAIYQQAKERCLFDGCEITEDEGIKYLKLTDKNHIAFYNFDDKFKDKTIEDYSFDYGLILTTTAQKQIGF